VKPQTLSTLSDCHHTSAKALKKMRAAIRPPAVKAGASTQRGGNRRFQRTLVTFIPVRSRRP